VAKMVIFVLVIKKCSLFKDVSIKSIFQIVSGFSQEVNRLPADVLLRVVLLGRHRRLLQVLLPSWLAGSAIAASVALAISGGASFVRFLIQFICGFELLRQNSLFVRSERLDLNFRFSHIWVSTVEPLNWSLVSTCKS